MQRTSRVSVPFAVLTVTVLASPSVVLICLKSSRGHETTFETITKSPSQNGLFSAELPG